MHQRDLKESNAGASPIRPVGATGATPIGTGPHRRVLDSVFWVLEIALMKSLKCVHCIEGIVSGWHEREWKESDAGASPVRPVGATGATPIGTGLLPRECFDTFPDFSVTGGKYLIHPIQAGMALSCQVEPRHCCCAQSVLGRQGSGGASSVRPLGATGATPVGTGPLLCEDSAGVLRLVFAKQIRIVAVAKDFACT